MKRTLYKQKDEGGKLTIDATLLDDGSIEIFFYDVGPAAKAAFGDSDIEKSLKIPTEQLGQLALSLLADKFEGSIHAFSKIEDYCRKNDVEYTGWSY